MTPSTHIKIAKIALEQIKGRSIYLNEKAFILGNVVPDFSPYHKIIRHYQENSFEYLVRAVSDVIETKELGEKSFKLGIICHYISDYFCYPHFNNMKFSSKDIMEHIMYEKDLEIFSKSYRADLIKEYTVKDLVTLIDNVTQEYSNTMRHKNDMESALSGVINLIGNISKWKPLVTFA